jgi:hypothetical protein
LISVNIYRKKLNCGQGVFLLTAGMSCSKAAVNANRGHNVNR